MKFIWNVIGYSVIDILWNNLPGGVGPMRGASAEGDASWDGNDRGTVDCVRCGGCVALQYP